jgi:cytochrome oxidase Cu insertion factor (SCO1/SenC/PrrC family)
MLPMIFLFVCGYVAMVSVPATVDLTAADGEQETTTPTTTPPAAPGPWWERATLSYVLRSAAAVAALAVVLVGTAPMAVATVNRNADPILTEALDGTPNSIDAPAPAFTLTDQHGHSVSLRSLRGHVIALTFLDPVCTVDCPLIAQEFRQTDQSLAGQADDVDFVAVVANPIYRATSFTNAFDRQEGLSRLPNWYYLTGSLSALQRVWDSYGIEVDTVANGAMIAHSDLAFVIDGHGRERDALITDPGPTQVFASSFSSLLLSRIDQALTT